MRIFLHDLKLEEKDKLDETLLLNRKEVHFCTFERLKKKKTKKEKKEEAKDISKRFESEC